MKPSTVVASLSLVLVPFASCASVPGEGAPAARTVSQAAADALFAAGAQPVTLASIWGSETEKVAYGGTPAPSITWLDATSWVVTRTDPKSKSAVRERVDAHSGAATPHQPVAALEAALRLVPGVDADEARRLSTSGSGVRDARGEAQAVVEGGDLWIARSGASAAVRVTQTPDVAEEEVGFSPDGARVAFVAANDLWVADARTGVATRLTADGSENVLNGKLDWIYQEELYGRGNFRGWWWSPDARTIAHLRLDQTAVPRYTLVEDGTYRAQLAVETFPYPRAGEPNPLVALRLVDVASGASKDVDLARWRDAEPLVANVHWSPDARLHYQVQDREQTWLELRACAANATGDALLVRETTQAWVDRGEVLEFLPDGSFLWASERTGWRHLYRYRGAELVNAVTRGEWEVRDVHGVDARTGRVYFSGTERSHIGLDAYAVGLDGTGLVRLTQRPGTHVVKFNPDFTLFEDTWSDIGTPPQKRLHRADDGAELRVIDANPSPALAQHGFQRPELLQIRARDGFVLEAMRILPPGYEPGRRHPVMVFGYWGPHAPTVKDAWGGSNGMFLQMVAQQGIVVWSCDGRTSSGKGAVSTWPCYQRLGEVELQDLLDGVEWLVDSGVADPERIGITGWSYGGFQTAFALAKSDRFRVGIAGGSVTDWRNYDSIYTERFMRTPRNNPDGYARTSVVAAAEDVTGRLVLVHGAIDENVHPANTMQFARALQRAGKPFDMMIYPETRHGPTGAANAHWRALQFEAIRNHLLER